MSHVNKISVFDACVNGDYNTFKRLINPNYNEFDRFYNASKDTLQQVDLTTPIIFKEEENDAISFELNNVEGEIKLTESDTDISISKSNNRVRFIVQSQPNNVEELYIALDD